MKDLNVGMAKKLLYALSSILKRDVQIRINVSLTCFGVKIFFIGLCRARMKSIDSDEYFYFCCLFRYAATKSVEQIAASSIVAVFGGKFFFLACVHFNCNSIYFIAGNTLRFSST